VQHIASGFAGASGWIGEHLGSSTVHLADLKVV